MFKVGFNSMLIKNFQRYKLDFKKADEAETKLATFWIIGKARDSQKNNYFCFIDYAKAFDCGSQRIVENSSRDGTTRPPYLLSEKSVCRSRSNSQNWTWEKQTGSKLGKEYIKAVYCHPAYLNYTQSTSCKMPGWRKHKLKSRLQGEILIISDRHMTEHLWQKAKNN